MYKKYFSMRNEPFSPLPAPGLFYKSAQHTVMWRHIVNSLRRREPVVMIPGEYGMGKTLLYLKLIESMRSHLNTPVVSIPSPVFNFSMLLERIAKVLNLPVENMDHEAYLRGIFEYFEAGQPKENKFLYLIIDDIHEFGFDFIEGLSRIITLNIQGHFPVKLFMFGHTSFLKDLEERNMVSFVQRIKSLPALAPLSLPEVTEYIYFRLIASGASGSPVFDDRAVALVSTASRGIPRLINKICDNSLLLAYKKEINLIDQQVVSQILKELGGRFERFAHPQAPPVQAVPASPVQHPVPHQIQPEPQHQYSGTNYSGAANYSAANGPDSGGSHFGGNHHEYSSSGPGNRGQDGKGRATIPDGPEGRRENVFSEAPEKKARSRIRKPESLKKNSFMDNKNLIIICLVLVIILMCFAFFRNFLPDRITAGDVVKNKHMIVRRMGARETVQEKLYSVVYHMVPQSAKEADKGPITGGSKPGEQNMSPQRRFNIRPGDPDGHPVSNRDSITSVYRVDR